MSGLEIFQWATAAIAWVAAGFALRSMVRAHRTLKAAERRWGKR
jgi:hypothetical protein